MTQMDVSKSSTDYLRKIRVMVVDSDQRILDLMVNVLRHLGFGDVFGVRDGFKAVLEMRERDVDLIITNWELEPVSEGNYCRLPPNPIVYSEMWTPVPPKDGACFVKYVRLSKYSPNPYIAIIMMAGLGLQNYIEYARDCGVNEILLKPLSMESLCRRIAMVIDATRPFVTSQGYKGPCRRNDHTAYYGPERRKLDVKVFKHAG